MRTTQKNVNVSLILVKGYCRRLQGEHVNSTSGNVELLSNYGLSPPVWDFASGVAVLFYNLLKTNLTID